MNQNLWTWRLSLSLVTLASAFRPVQAQPSVPPTVVWQQYAPQPEVQRYDYLYQINNINRLPGNRYAVTGYYRLSAINRPAWLLLLNPAGDSVGTHFYPALGGRGALFQYAQYDERTGLLLGATQGDSTNRNLGWRIFGADTAGNIVFDQFHDKEPGYQEAAPYWHSYHGRRVVLTEPTGYLTPFSQGVGPPSNDFDAGLLRTDRRGRRRQLWKSQRYWQGQQIADRINAVTYLLDGSLVSAGAAYNPLGMAASVYFGLDYWIVRHQPATLDTIETHRVGLDRHAEEAHSLVPTSDGGVILIGGRQQDFRPGSPVPPQFEGQQAEIVKLDSTLRVQWRRRVDGGAPQLGLNNDVCWVERVQPTVDGGYVALGRRVYRKGDPQVGPSNLQYEGFLLRLDAGGAVTWEQRWDPPFIDLRIDSTVGTQGVNFHDWSYNPDGTAVILGDFFGRERVTGFDVRHRWILKVAGLSAPWVPDYCRVPPGAPQLAVAVQQPQPGLFTFVGDSTTTAGPRYAELSQCTWDWGDGTSLDTGWVVSHQYLSSVPVRVRQCVSNNLSCQSCTDYYPLGLLTGRAEEQWVPVRVWPNPSASGGFTLAGAAGATFTVHDAVGRRVAAGMVRGAEAALDLRAQPAGVYALRLTWADGRSVSRRLLRW